MSLDSQGTMLDEAKPLVSVILPVYNAENFIGQAVESLLCQTHTNFEIIAVNDGSSDASAGILEQHRSQDARVKVIHTPNRGLVAALNLAIEHANGQLLARMDADDICEPERFAQQVAHMQHHADCVAVGCAITSVDTAGHVLSRQTKMHTNHKLPDRCRNFEHFPPAPPTIPHPTAMIRSMAMKHAGGYRDYFRLGSQDRDLWWRLSRLGRIDCVPQRLLRYRSHDNNRSRLNRIKSTGDLILADLSAVVTHANLDHLKLLEAHREGRTLGQSILAFDELIGKRFPTLEFALYRIRSRKAFQTLSKEEYRMLSHMCLRRCIPRPLKKSTWLALRSILSTFQ